MNHLTHAAESAPRSLPSARTLALMAIRLDGGAEPRIDQRPAPYAGAADASAGPGWFESSFELERGLQVLEGAAGLADEWLRLGGFGGAARMSVR